jgi:glycosyltransferase involved in cell wall biosynthesis
MKFLLLANTDWFLYNFRLDSARRLAALGHQVVLASPAGKYAARLEQEGFTWREVALERRGMNPLREAASIWGLLQLYRREKPDLVHHFTIKCVLYGTLAGRLAGVPAIVNSLTGLGYVFTGQNSLRRTLAQGLVGLWYRVALRKTWTIFENPDDQQSFLQRGWADPERSFVILGAGVDTGVFSPQPEPERAQPVVTLPSRLLWDKGVGEFVEAARLLRGRGCRAVFRLVGDADPGNPTCIPEETLATWRAEGIVEIEGWQEQMPAVYADANLICLPSYREGLPKTLAEAAASGRAIVSTDVPGCRHVVRDGENGLLAPAQDAAALAERIETLLTRPALRRQMAANGRKLAEEYFASPKIVAATLRVYAQATENNQLLP